MLRYFCVAGVSVRLEADTHIAISDKMSPFLLSDAPENIGYEIILKKTEKLPDAGIPYYSNGVSHYEMTDSGKRIFFSHNPGSAPFAVAEFYNNNRVILSYRSVAENMFDSTTAVFHKTGFENLLLDCNRLLLHCSFIIHKEKALLFSAPSETGKSTQARLWKDCFGAEIINDDRAAVAVENGCCSAHGVPFSGTSDICNNRSSQTGAIIVLSQGKENSISLLSPSEAFMHLYPQISVHQWEKSYVDKASRLLLCVIEHTPVYKLSCLPDRSAADLLYQTLIDGGVY